ncbi:hypothetical protein ACFUJR_00975 [Streptomyces sp. NPDC057271]|uniref:hypothetical protein n=1 Tax=unclassified Streptomyces TaxID=2593676 RepID=UPI0036262C70
MNASVVWVLEAGEDYEGGEIKGVFATRDTAKGAFVEAAQRMPFGLDGAREDEDGSLHLHGGCDWLSLRPYPVQTQAALPEGGAS